MSIGPRACTRSLRSVPSRKYGRLRKFILLVALLAVLALDFGRLAVDLATRHPSTERARTDTGRSNAVFRPPMWRAHGDSARSRAVNIKHVSRANSSGSYARWWMSTQAGHAWSIAPVSAGNADHAR